MILGIDASNIKAGGGLVHLKNIIKYGRPDKYGIKKVIIWGGKQLEYLDDKPWLEKRTPELLMEGGFINETRWKLFHFKKYDAPKCDLIFAPGGTFYSKKIPYVSMSQNMLVFDSKERNRYFFSKDWIRLNLLNFVQARSIKNAIANIFISKYAQKTISESLKIENKPSMLIYHGISNIFRAAPKENLSIKKYNNSSPFKILYVSIIDEYKHQWILVEAVSKLTNEDELPVELHLVGGYAKSAKKKFDKAISNFDPQEKFVKYHGKISHDILPEKYSEADLFAFSSSCENMPNILIEAICSGLPVISSNYGPMVEIIGEEGIYYNPTSVESTYNALKEAIMDSKRREQLTEISKRLSGSFSWQECSDQTFEFISSCLRSQ